MNKLLGHSMIFLKRNSSTILTCIGAAGVVATSVMAVKATPKAMLLLEEAKEKKGEDLTKLEVVKTAAPAYIPSVIIGASTIACIFGANVLNKHRQASLMSAYALLDNSYREYRNKVEELYGEETDNRIISEIAKDNYKEDDAPSNDEKQLFFDYYSIRYFESTMEDVLRAEYTFNKNFVENGYASLNDFYKSIGLEPLGSGFDVGWSLRAGKALYGYSWIDFEHEKAVMDDNLECYIITMPNPPTQDYINY